MFLQRLYSTSTVGRPTIHPGMRGKRGGASDALSVQRAALDARWKTSRCSAITGSITFSLISPYQGDLSTHNKRGSVAWSSKTRVRKHTPQLLIVFNHICSDLLFNSESLFVLSALTWDQVRTNLGSAYRYRCVPGIYTTGMLHTRSELPTSKSNLIHTKLVRRYTLPCRRVGVLLHRVALSYAYFPGLLCLFAYIRRIVCPSFIYKDLFALLTDDRLCTTLLLATDLQSNLLEPNQAFFSSQVSYPAVIKLIDDLKSEHKKGSRKIIQVALELS